MRQIFILALATSALCANTALAASTRLIVDDDGYMDKVSSDGAMLLKAGKLVSSKILRAQIHEKSFPISLPPLSHQRLDPPDLFDRMRESTLSVGNLYKCPDCGDWHFNGSVGFIVSDTGLVCTCCHVVLSDDKGIIESYLVAADSNGRVFPVKGVVAADPESDTCFLKIDATGLKPLPLRPGVRTGERVYCLSHPGGYYFMFTQGMVARLNLKQNEMLDEHGHTNGLLSRPILFLNVTAEFAPGSSGAPIVDESGNVVAQVASIADAGEPLENADENAPASPSVPVRFCTATEEILRLTGQAVVHLPKPENRASNHDTHKPKSGNKPKTQILAPP